ncbi:hypothetical protein Ancab_016848, partial [Ancistrocladus abbreviatus]
MATDLDLPGSLMFKKNQRWLNGWMDGIWIGSYQLHVNVARKKGNSVTRKETTRWVLAPTIRRFDLSFADVVRKEKTPSVPKQEKTQLKSKEMQSIANKLNGIQITPRAEELEWLN